MPGKAGAGDAEDSGGLALVSGMSDVGLVNMLSDGGVQSERGLGWSVAVCRRVVGFGAGSCIEVLEESDVVGQDFRAVAEKGDGAERVMEFAQVSRPWVVEKEFHGVGVDRVDGFADFDGGGLEFGGDESGQVFGTVTEGWDEEAQPVKAVVEIAPEVAVTDVLAQRAVGGGDDARIRLQDGFGAEPLKLAIFNSAENLGLSERAHFGDFVEKKGALIGQLELAASGALGSGEGTAFMAEKLTFQKSVAHGGGVEGDERSPAATGGIVDSLSEKCFSRAGFAKYQHRDFRRGGANGQFQATAHCRVVADQLTDLKS